MVEALFRAYFNEGRDIGDREVLIDVGATTGPDRTHLAAMYASNEGQSEVDQGLQRAAVLRISRVPRVLVAGVPLFSGAIRPELMETRLRMAADHGQR